MFPFTTKNGMCRVRKTKAGYVIECQRRGARGIRWAGTICKPSASLAKAKRLARYIAGETASAA